MVKKYIADATISAHLRDKQINEIRAELAAELIARSEVATADHVVLTISTRKKRRRRQTDVNDVYIITGAINVS